MSFGRGIELTGPDVQDLIREYDDYRRSIKAHRGIGRPSKAVHPASSPYASKPI